MEGKQHLEWEWKASDGTNRYVHEWPCNKPKAIVFYFHGLRSHGGYKNNFNFCAELVSNQYYVFSMDQKGHGRSATDEDRGHIENWGVLIDDASHFVKWVLTESGKPVYDLPFFLAGWSMGGCVVIHTCLLFQELFKNEEKKLGKQFKGTILIAPALENLLEPSWPVLMALKSALYMGGSRLALGPGITKDNFINEELYNSFISDPYVYTANLMLGTGSQLLEMTQDASNKVHLIEFPFLVVHGTGDKVIPHSGSHKLHKLSQTLDDDKTILIYENATHSLYDDPNSKDVIKDIVNWLNARSSKSV